MCYIQIHTLKYQLTQFYSGIGSALSSALILVIASGGLRMLMINPITQPQQHQQQIMIWMYVWCTRGIYVQRRRWSSAQASIQSAFDMDCVIIIEVSIIHAWIIERNAMSTLISRKRTFTWLMHNCQAVAAAHNVLLKSFKKIVYTGNCFMYFKSIALIFCQIGLSLMF